MPKQFDKLQLKAQKLLHATSEELRQIERADIHKLFKDLQVYQFELERQNKKLRLATVEIQKSEAKYSDLYDFAPLGYFTFDRKGVIIEVNIAGADLLGVAKRNLIKHKIRRFAAYGYRGTCDLHLHDVLKTRLKQMCALKFVQNDGTEFWARLESIAVKNDQGNYNQIRTAVLNITDQVRAEQALRESESRYRAVVEDQTELICRWLPDGTLTFVNKAYCRYFNKRMDELIGSNFIPMIPLEDHVKVQAHFASINVDNPVAIHEHRAIVPSGEIRWHQWTNRALFNERGRLIEFQSVGRDITEQKKLQDEFLKAQKHESIGTLAGGVAHDFNNLLSVIMSNIELAQTYAEPGDDVSAYLSESIDACMRVRDLTGQFITFSKGGPLVKKTGCLAELSNFAADAALAESNIICEFAVMDGLWPVEFDEALMKHALSNLFVNAHEAMPAGGKVQVSAQNLIVDPQHSEPDPLLAGGPYIKLMIRDQGRGITVSDLTHVMDPYFTTKKKGPEKGLGLGLTTAYAIIRKHGGDLQIQSSAAGTTVCVYLPACVEC